MAGTELVVGVSADSNSRARKRASEVGGRITLAGAGGSLGQAIGVARGEVVAQAESARAQVSHNSISDGRGRSAVFFMLCSDGGQGIGQLALGRAGLVDNLDLSTRVGCGVLCIVPFSTITTPCPSGSEPTSEQCDAKGYGDEGAVQSRPPMESSMIRMLIAS
ncbi:hypothetical protein [Stenotrophomonas sp. SORGH_AS_0321]|uniref:hypothetical protein n=1 Tax=Stenotrophomonas sp. SORGH_AS_0321 TaxID=3041787 RepID=UPI0028566067|nr:hypothetical protein [Stenotrophomonas sp. SORGH_AS_0321]MDR6094908.1 hypothetical protein [Stenotrophomonas sp. SORGH_AS_0321]